MPWTISVDTLLHLLLFCAHIIIINNSVNAHGDTAASAAVATEVAKSVNNNNNADNKKPDYIHFDNKYYVENETYYSDKRQIIEEYFRQSATSVKSSSSSSNSGVKDHKFYVNMNSSGISNSMTTDSIINANILVNEDQLPGN